MLESASDWLAGETGGVPHRAIALEELITVWLANLNPAFRPFGELFDDDALAGGTAYRAIGEALREYFESRPRFGPEDQNLIDMLRAPAMASPDSLEGQLEYIRHHWADTSWSATVRPTISGTSQRRRSAWKAKRWQWSAKRTCQTGSGVLRTQPPTTSKSRWHVKASPP